jgi:hypothetical protein
MDEKGFRLSCECKKKRIVQRFRRREPKSKEPRKRESLTVVECMSPEGKYITPLVIYQSKAGPLCGWFREYRKEHYWYTTAEKGFNNTAISRRWIEQIFEPETRPTNPNEWRILIFDGFDAHLDPTVVDFANAHKISCFSLPSHCTHEGQPLDKALFGPMEHAYSELVSKQRVQVYKEKFQELYIEARQKVCSVDNAKAGFRATGIHPFNPLKVLEKCRLEDPRLTKSADVPVANTKQATSQQLLQDCGSEFTPLQPPPDAVELEMYRKKALENVQQLMESSSKPRSISTAAPTHPTADTGIPIPRLLRATHHINTLTATAQKAAADLEMLKAGESRLQDELCQRSEKQKADTRKIPNAHDTGSGGTDGGLRPRLAEELMPGNYLVERKRKRDEEEANGTWKKKKAAQARTKRSPKKTGKDPAQPPPKPLYPTWTYPMAAQYQTMYYPQQPVVLDVAPQACPPPQHPPQQPPQHPPQHAPTTLPSGPPPIAPLPPQSLVTLPLNHQPIAPLPPQSLAALLQDQQPVTSLPPQSLASLPPQSLASLPPQSLASLPPQSLASLPPQSLASLPPQSLAPQPLTPLPPGQQSLPPSPRQPLTPSSQQPLASRSQQPFASRSQRPLVSHSQRPLAPLPQGLQPQAPQQPQPPQQPQTQ